MRSCIPRCVPPITASNGPDADTRSSGSATIIESDPGMSSFGEYDMNPYNYTPGSTFSAFQTNQDANLFANGSLLPEPFAVPRGNRASTECEPTQRPSVWNTVKTRAKEWHSEWSSKEGREITRYEYAAIFFVLAVGLGVLLAMVIVKVGYIRRHHGCNPHPRIVSQVRNGTDRLTTIIESEDPKCRMGPEHMDWEYFTKKSV